MLFLKPWRKREMEEIIEHKEVLIQRRKEKMDERVESDLKDLRKINKILGNGITLHIHQATAHGGRNA